MFIISATVLVKLSLNPAYYHPQPPTHPTQESSDSSFLEKLIFGMEALFNPTSISGYVASLQELLWLAIILLLWSYLSHFESDCNDVKSKVG